MRLRAAALVGCKESFRVEVASRDGVVTATDDATLPVKRKNSIAL